MKNFIRRRAGVIGAALLAATAMTAIPAHAEGSWSSYISNWNSGNESRRWTDNHTDSTSTQVDFSSCTIHAGDTKIRLELDRDISYWPDATYGMRDNYCGNSNWGEMSDKGSFYFIDYHDGGIDVGSVYTSY
ncbi:hypothetical protein [Kitasatospora cheerisanensis]|uniref:Uncharacterized protein n=1 Tax=Kitasatospora cheerisanensis KCTC 2395 TaxID=1348663 RepID=A0A066Z7F9_9ACTN|nr:hypothetical protein [Kitasatospora cheerisanensis]KDN86120.1 hypothetical protein KCH_19370 [Kitasatospora cheerisanensis KCTC 2395]